ncbi:maltose/maltodextrin ABC transporter substrate-binding protein MalE [Aquabacterium sp. OR-4]|uniref:maltose/maltodextrin ABC transporter substrate-binding protein MalE n=1 Tax=Aquabacterium sp. OR-4 TaxID=2978127 RepID=UPI0021B24558|nr:maltose/maltodextrin ABC transporter substrate-binding protein MalE [Aquabacterium sp. OR-4]MDT7838482.1 maltose/maltodextrin ABC transporter substrate-binding protein MalE [Aquabacterium sp. OR-4]
MKRRLALQGSLAASGLALAPGLRAQAPAPLVVWINGDKGYEGIARMAEAFTRHTGVPVRVDHPEGAVSKFEQASAAGKGPDIWIWPHDRAGGWAASGLIRPVAPARRTLDAISPLAWSAWRLNGRIWGWPIAIESVALLVNLDLVPEPPRQWDELFAIDRRLRSSGRRAIMWPYNEFYYAYGLVSAGGGYAFARRADGSWNAADNGVAHAGSQRGLGLLKRLVDEGLVPRTATYAESEAAMNEGRVAMTINGPWAWNNLRRSGLRVAAAPLPGIQRQPGRPMVGVLGAMIATASRQPVLAAEFIEHWLISEAGLRAMHAHVPLGVPANLALAEQLRSGDALVSGTMAAASVGEPMPNIPEMSRYWSAMNAAVQSVTQGRETVTDALGRAARRVAGGGPA